MHVNGASSLLLNFSEPKDSQRKILGGSEISGGVGRASAANARACSSGSICTMLGRVPGFGTPTRLALKSLKGGGGVSEYAGDDASKAAQSTAKTDFVILPARVVRFFIFLCDQTRRFSVL